MTQARTFPTRVGITVEDLPEWERLRDAPRPMVTAYVDTVLRDATGAKEIALTWRETESRLRAEGAPAAALRAVAERIPGAHQHADTLMVVADETGVLLERDLDAPIIGGTRATFSRVPLLTPLVEWMQSREPHVVVVVDHAGADLAVFDRHNGSRIESVGEEDHSDPELHNTKPGGWSQARYQRRTKGRWRANAGEAAQRLVRLVNEVRPRVVAVAGDVRSVQFFLEQLPPTVREQVREISGTRARDGSEDLREDEVARLIRTVVAEDTVMLAQKLAEELGQADRGVAGPDATLAALAEARVDTLLVHDDRADDRTAWTSFDLGVVSTSDDELRTLGARDVTQARLVDAAVRAAFSTGAAVRIVPTLAALPEGIGALLRH